VEIYTLQLPRFACYFIDMKTFVVIKLVDGGVV